MKTATFVPAILALVASALVPAARAEPAGEDRLVGLRAGIALSGARLDPEPPFVVNIVEGGPVLGFFYVRPLTRRLAFQPGLDYVQKAYSLDTEPPGVETKTTFRFHYLDVPLLLRVSPFPERGFRMLVGPVPSFLLDARATTEAGSSESSRNFTDQMKRLDLGLAFGLAQQFKKGFNVDIRYTHGLLDVSKASDQDLKIWSLALTLGWAFRLP